MSAPDIFLWATKKYSLLVFLSGGRNESGQRCDAVVMALYCTSCSLVLLTIYTVHLEKRKDNLHIGDFFYFSRKWVVGAGRSGSAGEGGGGRGEGGLATVSMHVPFMCTLAREVS